MIFTVVILIFKPWLILIVYFILYNTVQTTQILMYVNYNPGDIVLESGQSQMKIVFFSI